MVRDWTRDIDPALRYCPACHDEYRADIRRCAACGIGLVDGAELMARLQLEDAPGPPSAIREGEVLVAAWTGPVLQMRAVRDRLQAKGYPSQAVRGEVGCGCRGTRVTVLVREADLPGVTEVLTSEHRESTALDSHDLQAMTAACADEAGEEEVCPACGGRLSPEEAACPDCGLCFG